MVKSIAATILLVAGFPAPTTASDSPECTPDQAFIELQERARAGSADARYWVAVSQLTGANCQEQDPRRAAESFSQAARMGHVKARHELANLKLYRLDPPEPAEGIALLRQNVELGHMESATTLGKVLADGEFVPQDLQAARRYFEQAAPTEPVARLNLAELLVRDSPGSDDIDRARGLLKSAAREAPLAACPLCLALTGPNAFGFERDYRAALPWCRAGALHDVACAAQTGIIFLRGGDGVARDTRSGIAWLTRATQLGDAASMFALGRIYLEGMEVVAQDPALGMKYIRMASDAGYAPAKAFLETAP